MKLSNRRFIGDVNKIELSMTAMIDVVFLLLIFFLVTTTFVPPERHVAAGIQADVSAGNQSQSDLQPAVIEIIGSGDQTFFQLGAIRTASLHELKTPLEQFQDKSEGAFVRVGAGVPFEKVAQTIGLCKSVGFISVAYIPGD